MQAERKPNAHTEAGAASPANDGKREQSGIAFPYADLDAAVAVVRDIQQIGGQTCEAEQLAGLWRIAATGGAFRARYAPARTFGLLTVDKGRFTLTQLGMRISDRTQETAARVDAFLHVPLYKAVYEKYRNYQLPGDNALEAEMVRLGVSAKQKGLARQVLSRSARQAGFHWAGEDRLVKPNVAAAAQQTPAETMPHDGADRAPNTDAGPRTGGSGGGGSYHPFIEGLLQTLPEPGTVWAIEGRAAWLMAAAQNFTLIYKGEGRIDIQPMPAPQRADKAAA
ncbi:MAG: hypothetical protein FJX62_06270 [Alphaproteobacteria bacterium]|nr:hypothetical protein [Alphaproteobacteria bacterium]